MSPDKPAGRTIWRLYVPTRTGWVRRSTGTRDRATARGMERMLEALGPKGARAWDLLDAVADGRLTVPRLYDAYRTSHLETLRAQLDDLDLTTLIPRWQAALVNQVRPDTAARYLAHLRTLMPAGTSYYRSQFTVSAVDAWLASRGRASGTIRRYHAAASSFATYLVRLDALPTNPLHSVPAPPAPAPRVEALDLEDVRRLVDAAEEPYRSLFAFLYGTGCDLSTALGLTKRDVRIAEGQVRARGTKTHTRDRLVYVAAWALPLLLARCRSRTPDTPLWPGVTRYQASKIHRALLAVLKLPAHRLHDARHHWAVRMLRAGTPVELVARQLGHVDGVLVLRVYGRFLPRQDDQRIWDERATAVDAKRGAR